jgi:hypothetical protein
LIDEFGIQFDHQPVKIPAYKLEAGRMIMGKDEKGEDIAHDIDVCGRDMDRKVQCQMWSQPPLTKWGIFFQEKDSPSAREFINQMERVIF